MNGLSPGSFDVQQIEYLNTDHCIIVDEKDNVLRSATKMECHLKRNINSGLLHRAFSLFLFDLNNNLLLQQRSDKKITYPLHFTNTCCSHPLFNDKELDEKDNVGVKRAAVRKIRHELGIDLNVNDVKFVTRILYKADNGLPDEMIVTDSEKRCQYFDFGENELDYILVSKLPLNQDDLVTNINPNEVASVKWVGPEDVNRFVKDCAKTSVSISPWFRLIHASGVLHNIWKHVDRLDAISDDKITHLSDE